MQKLFLGSDLTPAGPADSLPVSHERGPVKPLRGVIASWDERFGLEMRHAIAACNPFLPVTMLSGTLATHNVERVLETERAAVLFLDVERTAESIAILDEVYRLKRGTQIIAFSRYATQDVLLEMMRRGLREWVKLPDNGAELRGSLDRVRQALDACPPSFRREGHVFSFLPAKPGSGASTVAAHAASLLAASLRGKAALIDLDLNCGIQGFIHAMSNSMTVADAAEYADRMDDALWQRMVVPAGNVDVLRSGTPSRGHRIEPAAIQALIDFAEARYPVVCADLSGNWERFAMETIDRSTLVFLVATPDFASLHLARRHLNLLDEMQARSRARVILNRCAWRHGLDATVVREILGVAPTLELPNTFAPLQSSLKLGQLLPASAPFVQALSKLPAQALPSLAAGRAKGARSAMASLRSWLSPATQDA